MAAKEARISLVLLVVALTAAQAAQAAVNATTKSALELKVDQVRTEEVGLGSLVADAVRAAGDADVAVVPANALKAASIKAGAFTSADVAAALAFPDDVVVVMQLTGDKVVSALEKSVSIYPQKHQGFLQVSGVTFAFDPKKPVGQRVSDVKVGGKAITTSATYKVAASNSFANGALGYWRIWGKDQIGRKTGTTMSKAVEDYLKRNATVDYSKAGRITRK